MRLALFALIFAVVPFSCDLTDGNSDDASRRIVLSSDSPFSLRVGDTAVLTDLGIEVTFTDLTQDSRCPRNVECFWEGQVDLQLRVDAGDRSSTIGMTGWVDDVPREGQDVTRDAGAYRVKLLALAPYPTANPRTGHVERRGTDTATFEVEAI